MWGWRHFQVVNRKDEGKWVFAEMVASCDPEVRFWINARSIKDRSQWQPGWQSLAEMAADNDDLAFTILSIHSQQHDRNYTRSLFAVSLVLASLLVEIGRTGN